MGGYGLHDDASNSRSLNGTTPDEPCDEQCSIFSMALGNNLGEDDWSCGMVIAVFLEIPGLMVSSATMEFVFAEVCPVLLASGNVCTVGRLILYLNGRSKFARFTFCECIHLETF